MSSCRTWWMGGVGDERVLLTTDAGGLRAGERLQEAELATLVWGWLADRSTRSQLARLYADLNGLPEPPTTWAPHELETVVGRFVQAACASGWLVALREPLFARSPGGQPQQPGRPEPPRPPPVEPPSRPAPPSKPPSKPIGPPEIERVSLAAVTITSDHGMLKDHTSTWRNEGELFDEPEWTANDAVPVSHDMNVPVRLEVLLEVGPSDATPETAVLRGFADGIAYTSSPVTLAPGEVTVAVIPEGELDEAIRRVAFDVSWNLTWTSSDLSVDVAPKRSTNTLFVTWATPREDGRGDGVTLRRMRRAVEWVSGAGTLDRHAIMRSLFARVPAYTLDTDDDVPAVYGHPHYFNEEGGAWALTDYPEQLAECQAICRMAQKMVHEVGILGETEIVVVWADPDMDGGTRALEAPHGQGGLYGKKREVGGFVEEASLLDGPVVAGQIYEGDDLPGTNNFEAALRFTADGVTKYYGGGAGDFDNRQEVLHAFWGLVWLRELPDDRYLVSEVVCVYP